MTALPIIETQAGDVSAYIPTNVISITDGQIYLETQLFNQGVRPAINAGLSVSRVGGAAQTKAMKKMAASLRVELAQYRELESFSQFGSELDKDTLSRLEHGKRLVEVLKQPQYQPMSMEEQVMILYAVNKRYLADIPVEEILEFERQFLEFMAGKEPEVGQAIAQEKVLSSQTEEKLASALQRFKEEFLKERT